MSTPDYDSPGMAGHRPLTPEDEERGYVISTWKGFPKFSCCKCAWDILNDEGMMRLHIAQIHVLKEAQERIAAESHPAGARLFDASGNIVERIPHSSGKPVVSDFPYVPEPPDSEIEISDELLQEIVADLKGKGLIEDGTDDGK